ncbi:MAG: hypothetical protein LBT35_00270 [Tannerella sp.]|jgi:hypothetical protein|nr:hypothetical protein [Tannerella sp.]
MNSAELYQWMTDTSQLNRSSLVELKQMVDDYPFFQAVRILYLKNLAMLEDIRLEKELKRMAVYIPDRRRLFMLLYEYSKPAPKVEESAPKVKTRTKTKADTAANTAASVRKKKPLLQSPSDYISWLAENAEDLPVEEDNDNQFKHQELIDSYIENEKQTGTRLAPPAPSEDDEAEDISGSQTRNEALEKPSLDDSYFTETLARVYIRQKKYDKALEIIRLLSLKYPEKNIYFADQIRYLEKIINLK